MLKRTSLVLMNVLFISAGLNHFIHPAGYLTIIPHYLPYHLFINIASGIIEIILGALLLFPATRKAGALGIIILLILFIPAHIYMIQKGGCPDATVCWPLWVAWLRLFPIQFILIWWAWWNRK